MIPEPIATEIDGLRRATGDRRLTRIAPHVTLVPPVNLDSELAATAVDHCRMVAATHRPLILTIGPPASFRPDNNVVYLAVGLTDPLAALRAALHDGPLARLDRRAFVPHVTLNARCEPDRIDAVLAALADYRAEVVIEAVEVLEFVGERWQHRERCPLAAPAVIGRGGLEVELAASTDGERITVVARHLGEVVGVAVGRVRHGRAELWDLHADDRVGDVSAHLLAAFADIARRHGGDEVVALDGATLADALEAGGFTAGAGVWTRRL